MLEKLPEDEQREAVRILQNWMDIWKKKRGVSRYKGETYIIPHLSTVCLHHMYLQYTALDNGNPSSS